MNRKLSILVGSLSAQRLHNINGGALPGTFFVGISSIVRNTNN
jgi:hypothetical protein